MNDSTNELKIQSSPSKNIISAARSHLINSFRKLNLFSDDPFWSSTLTYSEQIISTRLFLIFISISLFIVIIYSSLSIVTHDVTLYQFSRNDFEKLEQIYPSTINAPCSDVSIPYNNFLSLSPIFHEVCSSEFISDKWISSLFFLNATSHNILDYRTFAFSQYRSLSLLCNISQQSVKDTHHRFSSTNLITRHVLSRIQFDEISSVLFNNLQKNFLTNEKRTGHVISMITAQNRLISALRTNYYIESIPGSKRYITYNGAYLEQNQTNGSFCDCRFRANQCVYPAGAFYNWTLFDLGEPAKNDPPALFQIPGLMAGCLPLDSMRQSTLECLYNQTCINAISLQPEISQPKALNKSLTRFLLNSTIGSIFDESLFVESWQNKSNFEKYFSACAPRSLSYSYQARFHFGTILTLSLSAFGGLVIGCKLITPIFIKIFNRIKRKKRKEQTEIELETMEMPQKTLNQVVISHVHRAIYNFNLFPSDKKEERIGIISTRLYILLICIGLLILGFYIGLSEHNHINVIKNPSISEFEELDLKYSSTLNCPCSRFSMSYGHIISISARYHSICSSEYLKDYWLSYFGRIEIDLKEIYFFTTDFRISGQSFFDLINVLCKVSNETIQDAINVFKTNRLVTMNTLSYKQFYIETQTRLELFKQETISSFLHLIKLIRSAIQTNQLVEETWTNVGPFSTYDNQTSLWSLSFRPRDFYPNSCSCALSNKCTRPVGFYSKRDNIRSTPKITVPGLVFGCYAIDSLLLSTLECLYDKNCIKILLDNYDFDVVGLVRPLDNRAIRIQPLSNKNSRFYPNTTINEIFSQLFVEDWINSTNYTSYYTRCQPSQCIYTVLKRFDIAHMFTIMLGFYGGLSVILEIILPTIVKLFIQRWTKRNKQIQTDHIDTDRTINSESLFSKEDTNNFVNMFKRLSSLNLFVSDPPSTEKQYENHEIVATRLYIFLFLLSIIVALLSYGPFNKETKLIKIKNPSIDIINNLHKKNVSSLSCPCSKVAIHYSKFLSVEYKFHPICSSEFVSPLFLLNLNDSISDQLIAHYRILSSLCNISNEFLQNANKSFANRELITVEPLTKSSFNIEIKSLISNFLRQIRSDYRRRFSFIINSFSVNQLLNLFRNNWRIDFTNETEKYLIKTIPYRFPLTNCTCAISSNCNQQLIQNIHIGCFPYDGFRLSKFKNISLGKLNNQLFIQKSINKTNYTNYFETCQPLECQYKLPDKNNPIVMFTTFLGLYGGLTYFLRLIIGQSLLAYRWWVKRKRESL